MLLRIIGLALCALGLLKHLSSRLKANPDPRSNLTSIGAVQSKCKLYYVQNLYWYTPRENVKMA